MFPTVEIVGPQSIQVQVHSLCEKLRFLPTAGCQVKSLRRDAECRVRRPFRGQAHERSRSHREAQHAKLRPSTQQRDIVPYQSTLSGENRSSSPGKSNVRNAHLLTSFSQSLKARYEIAQRFA